ncbi:MAG: hypothetical protein WKF77_22885 [Planctomycetaceae bacterium]
MAWAISNRSPAIVRVISTLAEWDPFWDAAIMRIYLADVKPGNITFAEEK